MDTTDSEKSPRLTPSVSVACRRAAKALSERTKWRDAEFDEVVGRFGLKGDEDDLIALLQERGWVYLSGRGYRRITEPECLTVEALLEPKTRYSRFAPACACERCEEIV